MTRIIYIYHKNSYLPIAYIYILPVWRQSGVSFGDLCHFFQKGLHRGPPSGTFDLWNAGTFDRTGLAGSNEAVHSSGGSGDLWGSVEIGLGWHWRKKA